MNSKVCLETNRMADFGLGDVQIFDDKNDMDLIKNIVENADDDEPFYILNLEDIVEKHTRWIKKMPRVIPHYAVKCNPHPVVVRALALLNAGFDCASKPEIQLVMKMGVEGDRIIYAHPNKPPSHIRYAKKVGVQRTTVDTKEEILKLKREFPEAKLVIRLAIDGSSEESSIKFSTKFGCKLPDVMELVEFTKEIGMTLVGFCFHLGSPCWDPNSYGWSIKLCSDLIKIAKTMGHSHANLIDIGGGFYGEDAELFDRVAASINGALDDVDPSIEVISEPGRYYVESAFTLAACVIGKRIIDNDGNVKRQYFVNDSTYGSFMEELLDIKRRIPVSLHHPTDVKYPSLIWGRTADPYDVILKNEMLPEFHVGDWMVWREMGAYGLALSSHFNGFAPAVTQPFVRKSSLKHIVTTIQNAQDMKRNKNKLTNARLNSDTVI